MAYGLFADINSYFSGWFYEPTSAGLWLEWNKGPRLAQYNF